MLLRRLATRLLLAAAPPAVLLIETAPRVRY